jgi:hypothetical protein
MLKIQINMFKKINANNFLIFLVLILDINQSSFGMKINKKKKIDNNFSLWSLKWLEKNKIDLISINNQQLKFRLYQELAKYTGIDQKIFDKLFRLILVEKKRILSDHIKEIKSKKRLYFTRFRKCKMSSNPKLIIF